MKTQFEHIIKKCSSGFYVETYRIKTGESWFVTSCFKRSGEAVNAALEEARLRDKGLSFRYVDGWPITDPPQPDVFEQIDSAARSLGLAPVGDWTME